MQNIFSLLWAEAFIINARPTQEIILGAIYRWVRWHFKLSQRHVAVVPTPAGPLPWKKWRIIEFTTYVLAFTCMLTSQNWMQSSSYPSKYYWIFTIPFQYTRRRDFDAPVLMHVTDFTDLIDARVKPPSTDTLITLQARETCACRIAEAMTAPLYWGSPGSVRLFPLRERFTMELAIWIHCNERIALLHWI